MAAYFVGKGLTLPELPTARPSAKQEGDEEGGADCSQAVGRTRGGTGRGCPGLGGSGGPDPDGPAAVVKLT